MTNKHYTKDSLGVLRDEAVVRKGLRPKRVKWGMETI